MSRSMTIIHFTINGISYLKLGYVKKNEFYLKKRWKLF